MLSYAAPMVACYFLLGPTYSVVPALYAKYFGLSLTTVAAVVLCTRMLDVFTDPVIGYLSDRHRRSGGARKAWVAIGGMGLVGAAYFLFAPPAQPSPGYYLLANLSFFVAYSLMEISHVTWGSELTRDYATRSTVYSYRSAAIFSGFILWAAFPLLMFSGTREFTPQVLEGIAYAGAALMLVTLICALARAPSGRPLDASRPDSWRAIAKSIVFNGPLRVLVCAYLLCVLALGMWQGLVFLYLDSYLGLSGHFAVMQLIANVAALGVIPVWKVLVGRFDKSHIWMASMVLFLTFAAGFLLLRPGAPWWQALILMALIHACFSCFYIVVPSTLADIVDYSELKFGLNRGAIYFAIANLLSKAGIGVGAAAALGIAGHYGVDPSQTLQGTHATWGLQLAYIVIPGVLALLATILIGFTPIDRRRHDIVRRRIESRARRAASWKAVEP
jgi:glycoside/pentoside/hexuronide:cation symporter, GPH family